LKTLDPGEARFASTEQFIVEKAQDRGGWVIRHVTGATNPTYLNGSDVPAEGAVLKTGDAVSIKDKYLRLAVRLLD
jgi:hypothetical protein